MFFLWQMLAVVSSFFLLLHPPRISPLFPYTTLFRSHPADVVDTTGAGDALAAGFLVGGVEVGLAAAARCVARSEEHTSELQSHSDLVCRLLLEKKNGGAPKMAWRPDTARRTSALMPD